VWVRTSLLVLTQENANVIPVELALQPPISENLQDVGDIVLDAYGRTEEGRSAFNRLRYRNQLLFVPVTWRVSAVIYNKDVFEKESIPVPESSLSHEEFLELVKRLTDLKRGQYGIGLNRNPEHFLSLLWQHGGRVAQLRLSHLVG